LPPEVVPLVRGFANNSFRYLFRQGDNVADLVRWRTPKIAQSIDFSRVEVQPDTFITPGFTELESDVLLRAPWRTRSASGAIQVFILIEHQSEPDEHAVFRAARYVMQVYDKQEKHWLSTHSNTRGLRFDPVLPIVFYSGTRTWEELTPMQQLVHHGELFGPLIPSLLPEFVNLAETEVEVLQRRVGMFGWVLWLIQQKRRKEAEFREILRRVVARVDNLHAGERARWQHLLWFAHALVYHARERPEREQLADFIRTTVRKSEQPEVQIMGKTIAEALMEEGEAKGILKGALATRRQTLLRLLGLRFKRVPPAIKAEIEASEDSQQLDAWLEAFATAEKLTDIPFQSVKSK
jgi:predicted transposase YdaD